jgi:hypothetical protein
MEASRVSRDKIGCKIKQGCYDLSTKPIIAENVSR